jgi:hypothetical protein
MLAFLAPFFLLSATVLLLLVSLSVPIIKSINLFALDAHASGSIGNLGDAGVTAYADFGVWGYCVSSLDVKLVCFWILLCVSSTHGFNCTLSALPVLAILSLRLNVRKGTSACNWIPQLQTYCKLCLSQVLPQTDDTLSTFSGISDSDRNLIQRGSTAAFVLHPIGTASALLAILEFIHIAYSLWAHVSRLPHLPIHAQEAQSSRFPFHTRHWHHCFNSHHCSFPHRRYCRGYCTQPCQRRNRW